MVRHVRSCDILRYQLQVFLHFEAMRVCCDVSFDTNAMADKVCVCVCVSLYMLPGKVICSKGYRFAGAATIYRTLASRERVPMGSEPYKLTEQGGWVLFY